MIQWVNLDWQDMLFEPHLETIMLSFMQMKYKLVRSVIFYSEALSREQGTHLSLISVVSHVIWDWSERERKPLWLPATQPFVAAQCHCHSQTVLMCSFLSTSINISPARHGCKWIGVQPFKIEQGEMLHLCFRCTWTLGGLNKTDIYFSYAFVEFCINGTVSHFQPWNVNLVPWGSSSIIPPVVVLSRPALAPLSVNGDVSSRLSDEVQKRSAF